MRSYHGAETCELVGCYILSQLKQIPGIEIGLYRDDGLAILNQTPRQIEKAKKKQICQIFASNNLKIIVDANKKVVNFLDVTLIIKHRKIQTIFQAIYHSALRAQPIEPPTQHS